MTTSGLARLEAALAEARADYTAAQAEGEVEGTASHAPRATCATSPPGAPAPNRLRALLGREVGDEVEVAGHTLEVLGFRPG